MNGRFFFTLVWYPVHKSKAKRVETDRRKKGFELSLKARPFSNIQLDCVEGLKLSEAVLDSGSPCQTESIPAGKTSFWTRRFWGCRGYGPPYLGGT